MYSTDDDLFTSKRSKNKSWLKPTGTQIKHEVNTKTTGLVDFRTSKKEQQRVDEKSSDSDFDFELKRSAALLKTRKKTNAFKQEKQIDKKAPAFETGSLVNDDKQSSSSDCLENVLESVKSGRNMLLKNRTQHNSNHVKDRFKPTVSSAKEVNLRVSSTKEGKQENRQRETYQILEDVKDFIGGQLRKGIEKAMGSAVMKLNQRLRNETESANNKMELLMKGLMDSYDLISRKVSELTHAYNAVMEVKLSESIDQTTKTRIPGDKNMAEEGLERLEDIETNKDFAVTKSKAGSARCDTDHRYRSPSRSHSKLSSPARCTSLSIDHLHSSIEDEVQVVTPLSSGLEIRKEQNHRAVNLEQKLIVTRVEKLETEIQDVARRLMSVPDVAELRSFRNILDDYDERIKQCSVALMKARRDDRSRQKRNSERLQKLVDEFRETRSSAMTKEDYFQSQVTSFADTLKSMKDVVEVLEQSKTNNERKTSALERYTCQIYEACKSTLKSVDLRYQTIKKTCDDVVDKQRIVDAKCDALAESLAILHRKGIKK